jgi:hypothetical protein
MIGPFTAACSFTNSSVFTAYSISLACNALLVTVVVVVDAAPTLSAIVLIAPLPISDFSSQFVYGTSYVL